MTQIYHIDFPRLRQDLKDLGRIGRREDYGVYRQAFSEGDMAARAWLKQRIEDAGLTFHQDGAANLFGRLHWDTTRPSVMMGSHIDTVPAAGTLDGALGVLTALECLRSIKEQGIDTYYPLEMVAFSDEEGRFGGLFGSQALCGELTPERIHQAVDLNGLSVSEAMARWDLNAMDALWARREPESVHRYLELHIEQGPVLDSMNLSVGAVENIAGLFKWSITLTGHANHAGTTPMHMRRDAFGGLAEFSGELTRILEENGSAHSVATIGKVDLFPGIANTVPGRVSFSLDVRDSDPDVLAEMGVACRKALSAIGRRRNLMFDFKVLSALAPTPCDPSVVETVTACAQAMDLPIHRMNSGAVHDAQIMAGLTKMGMIFVPSKDGHSHSSSEWTHWKDIETGADLALNTLVRLAQA